MYLTNNAPHLRAGTVYLIKARKVSRHDIAKKKYINLSNIILPSMYLLTGSL